jgi:hypothetical protein
VLGPGFHRRGLLGVLKTRYASRRYVRRATGHRYAHAIGNPRTVVVSSERRPGLPPVWPALVEHRQALALMVEVLELDGLEPALPERVVEQ